MERLNSSTFYLNLSSIVVTEVMYDPLPATAAEIAAGYVISDTSNPNRDFQYIEIENIGTQTLPVGGLEISGGINFTFPQYQGNVSTNPLLTLAPNQYLVAVADLSAFTIRYGAELKAKFGSNWQNLIVAGQFANHHLNDVSDEVELSSPNGGVIEDFTYQSSWYPQTQGGGFALMMQSPTEALSLCTSSSGWEASGTYNGTPGFADPVTLPLPGAVVVNEVLSNPTAPSGYPPGDMIEFYNTTSQSINIGGWFVGNNSSGLLGYEIAAGTAIAAGDYYVLTQAYNFGTLASDPGRLVPFTLDPAGDSVYLSSAYDFTVSSITGYPIVGGGTTATVVVSNTGYPLGAGLSNGEQINISGAAQTQYDGDFTIANVTVNSAAGTTSFTYTVSGSPASPATPIAGQSLAAVLAGGYQEQQTVNSMPPGYSYGLYTKSDGATNFTLLQTPSFGTLVGTTYSGAANSIPYVSPLVTDEIMYNPSQPTAAEAAAGYVDNDFEYVEFYNRSSSPVSLGNYYDAGGIGYTPGWLADGMPNEFETLESGATATWSASSLASASYTVYGHLNLYDGDNNLLSDLDSQAQYTVTCGSTSWTVVVDQDQVPATLSVTSLTYDNTSGLVTAAANNTLINNNSLVAGSIVHISGATPSQYDGTFVVQSATSTSFTYALASGLNLAAGAPGTPGPGTITAGLNDVWISLGTYILSGAVSVQLTRTSDAHPSEWTVAGGMELVSSSQPTTVLGTPTFSSYSIQHPTATLAAGQYAVLVSNYAAFEERYNPTGSSNILVLGVYSGHLSNGGDTVDIYQIGSRASGVVSAQNGYVPFYRVDHVNYNNAAPWPTQPDSNGSALILVNTADYGNDAINWEASNVGGTPGQANLVLDPSAPSIPASLTGYGVLSPTPEVSLTWGASSAPRSNVAYYVIYRNGSSVGTSTTTSFADTTAAYGTNYAYAVAAVNRDGYSSAPSTSIAVALPSMFSNAEPSTTQIVMYFSEPLTASVASTVSNYTVSGRTISGVALARDNTEVILTLILGHDAGDRLHGHHDEPDDGLRRPVGGHPDFHVHV